MLISDRWVPLYEKYLAFYKSLYLLEIHTEIFMNEIIGHMGFASKYYVSGEQVGIGIQQVWSGLMVFRAGGIGTQGHYSILSSL